MNSFVSPIQNLLVNGSSVPGSNKYENYMSVYKKSDTSSGGKKNKFQKSNVPNLIGKEIEPGNAKKIIHQVAFVMDATGSMGSYIQGTKEQIVKFIASLKEKCLDDMKSMPGYIEGEMELQFEVALIAYRDFCDLDHFEAVDFTINTSEIETYLQGVIAKGGGDTPEDVQGAFVHAFNGIGADSRRLSWETESNKEDVASRTILWLADAPAHGVEFDSSYSIENWIGNKSSYMQEWNSLFDEMKRLTISLIIVKLNNETLKTIETMKKLAIDRIEVHEVDVSQALSQVSNHYASLTEPCEKKVDYGFSTSRSAKSVCFSSAFPTPSAESRGFNAKAGYEEISKTLSNVVTISNAAMYSKKKGV